MRLLAVVVVAFGLGCGPPHDDAGPASEDRSSGPSPELRLWIETDAGGYPDDAYALAILANTPGVEIVGIGTTGGHGRLRAAWVRALLAAAGRIAAVHPGAESEGDGPIPAQLEVADPSAGAPPQVPAAEALMDALRAAPGEISILVLGAASNLAEVESSSPGTLGLAREIVVMGGAFEVGYDGRAPAAAEANVAADPGAFRALLEATSPLLVPLDLTWSATLPEELRVWLDSEEPAPNRTSLSDFLADQYRRSEADWGDDHRPVLHDVVAAQALLHPDRIESEPTRVGVESDGRIVVDADGLEVRRVTRVPRELVVDGLSRIFELGDGAPISQRSADSESLSLRRPVIIAHRGASAYAPEHTFTAWDLALDMGTDYLEQDLQMTADGSLVVIHDETLDRTARGPGCTGPVRERTLDELRECEVGSWFASEFATHALEIPTLAEVLARYGGRTRLYIETKRPDEAPGMEEALVAELDAAGLLPDAPGDATVLIQSFSPESLRRMRRLEPLLLRVQLLTQRAVGDDPEGVLAEVATYADGVGPAAALVDERFVAAARRHGLLVHPWTVNDADEMRRLLALGVDGIFTDVPDVLRGLVSPRGG